MKAGLLGAGLEMLPVMIFGLQHRPNPIPRGYSQTMASDTNSCDTNATCSILVQLKWLFFHNSDKITYNRFRIQTSFHWLGSMKGYSCRHVLGFFMNEAITLLSQTLTSLPLDERVWFFYSFAKERSVALEAPVGLFFSDIMFRRKYLFVEPLDILAFIITNRIIQLSCGRIFLSSLPTRLSIIDLWGVDCLFTPNCPIGEAKSLTS